MHLQSRFKADYEDVLLCNEDLKTQNRIKDETIREAAIIQDRKLSNAVTYNVQINVRNEDEMKETIEAV